MNEKPLVSVIIPTYNYACYVIKAIQSCFEQTYDKIEVIVVDDGSTDETSTVLAEFGKNIKVIYQDNQGVSVARNTGLKHVEGDFITFLDADDYFTKDSIEVRINILLKTPDVGIVVSDKYIQRPGQQDLSYNPNFRKDKISDKFYKDLLLKKLPFATGAALIRAELAKQFQFPVNITHGEDIAYFVKIFFAAKGYYLAKPTTVTFRHPGSSRYNFDKIKKQEMALVQTIFNDPYFHGALEPLRKEFTANRFLSFARTLYLAGDKKTARKYYLSAINTKPAKLLKLRYLTKFIRTFF